MSRHVLCTALVVTTLTACVPTQDAHSPAAQALADLRASAEAGDAEDFENVTGLVVPEGYKYPQLALEPQAHRLKLFLGPLADCCRQLASAGDSGRCNTADRAGQFSNGLDRTLLPDPMTLMHFFRGPW